MLIHLFPPLILVTLAVALPSNISGHTPTLFSHQDFPQWLTDITGLTDWPDADPPYVALDSVDLQDVPDSPMRVMGDCASSGASCAFDCSGCLQYDDIASCSVLSQTFDDGPTPSTLLLLESLNHRTTFFTVGLNVVRFPEIYHSIQERGHLLGAHTWSHKFLPSVTNEEIAAQLQWSMWAMNATGNHVPKWFRPPYGGLDDRVRSIARKFGMQAVLWSHDTSDWMLTSSDRDEEEIFIDVQNWVDSNATGLILEHDSHTRNVKAGLEISEIIGWDQMTVSECAGGDDYIDELL